MEYSKELIASLKAFGLSERESMIYLAGLELGPATILELSRRTELPRTTLYPILEQLRHQGLFTESAQKNKTHYTATPPTGLAQLFEEREKTLLDSIPALEALGKSGHTDAEIIMFEGTEGFKQLWQAIFRSGVKEYRLMTNAKRMLDYVKMPYLIERIIEERVRRGIKSYQLLPENRTAYEIIKNDSEELRESRFLPDGLEPGASMLIFGDQVAFITSRMENAMILVMSGDITKTHRAIFDSLWKSGKIPPSQTH